jgi:hypothetical protein
MQQDQISENFKKIETWRRIIFMLIYAFIDSMVKLLLWIVILLQLASVLISGKPNSTLLGFGRSLSSYHYHILLFLTFSTEQLAFPFAEWTVSTDGDWLRKD